MVKIYLNKDEFQYDVYTLVKAFFPREDCEVVIGEEGREADPDSSFTLTVVYKTGYILICDKMIKVEGLSRPETKIALKKVIYQILEKSTGRSLPWGNLTGIRPVKIAMAKVEEGMDDASVIGSLKQDYLISDKKARLSVEIAGREKKILEQLDYQNGYSLYIGIPFCPSTCLYCSFTSYPISRFQDKVDAYLDALEQEIDFTADAYQRKKLNTIYIGGGTPTTLSPKQLERLLVKLKESFDYKDLKELTVEAGRPDSITREKLQVMKRHGVTRISVNPQTMNQETLDLIGRNHTVDQINEVFGLARELGFDNINMDLIVGLPKEGGEQVKHTLEQIKKLKPDGITVHSLALKRAARLALYKDSFETEAFVNSEEIMDMTAVYAKEMGLQPYYLYRQKNMAGNFENVGYAAAGREGIYNILIMEEKQTIVALGAGAVTKIVYPDGRIERIENVKDVDHYLERIDEMLDRKKQSIIKLFQEEFQDLVYDFQREIVHGCRVSNLAYALGKELGLSEDTCYELAVSGMLHDIGKMQLSGYLYGRNEKNLLVEEIKFAKKHPVLGSVIVKERGYSKFVQESILHHHENYDGTGFPDNLAGEKIPLGARILRICDVFGALVESRPYRNAVDKETAQRWMIQEVRHFDMEIFLAFQRVVQDIDLDTIIDLQEEIL